MSWYSYSVFVFSSSVLICLAFAVVLFNSSFAFLWQPASMVQVGDTIVVGNSPKLVGISVADGTVQWELSFVDPYYNTTVDVGTPVSAGDGERIFVIDANNNVTRCINITDRTILWTQPSAHPLGPLTTTLDGDIAYQSGVTFFRLSGIDGTQMWNYTPPCCIANVSNFPYAFPAVSFRPASTPPPSPNEVLVFAAYDTVYAFDALTGERIWDVGAQRESYLVDRPGVSPDGSLVYVSGYYQKTLQARDAVSGRSVWVVDFRQSDLPVVVVPTSGALVLFHNEQMVALDGKTGAPLWQVPLMIGATATMPTVSMVTGDVYLVNTVTNYTITRIDWTSGNSIWEANPALDWETNQQLSPPLLGGVNNTEQFVLVHSLHTESHNELVSTWHRVDAFEVLTGALAWTATWQHEQYCAISSTEPCPYYRGKLCSGHGYCAICTDPATNITYQECRCYGNNDGADCSRCKPDFDQSERGAKCKDPDAISPLEQPIVVIIVVCSVVGAAVIIAAAIGVALLVSSRSYKAREKGYREDFAFQLKDVPSSDSRRESVYEENPGTAENKMEDVKL